MLKLILGRQKSGKTHCCLELAEQCVNNGENVIMLVPEQYSFECQKHLLESLGASVSNKIEIHSFTSLCEAICGVFGGVAGHIVDDGTRYILVGQAIRSVKDNLNIYGKYSDSQAFIKNIMSVITEFKQSSVTHEMLSQLAQNTESEIFKNKLLDTSLIISAYDALLKNRFIDPMDLVERTLGVMKDNSFFNRKTVIIDEFKGFTESQFGLLDRLVAGSNKVYVSLCCDSTVSNGETDIFNNIKYSAQRLLTIASNHNVAVEESEILSGEKYFSDDINALECFLADKTKVVYENPASNITVCSAADIYDEIDNCFNTIRRMVRTENYRYRDFVIISRDSNAYSNVIADVADIYDIPCYVDRRMEVSKLPLSVFIVSAISAAMSYDTEEILKFVKSGLLGLSVDEVSKLENYVYIWSINGNKWLDDWSMSFGGLDKPADETEIKEINAIRLKVIKPLKNLRFNLKGNVEEMCSSLLKLIDDCSTIDALRGYTYELEANGEYEQAEYQRAGYDAFIKVLDKLCAVSDDGEIKPRDFLDMLKVSLSYETVGEIPQTNDQVIYGTADRIRPMRPRVVFVVGANQDAFPAAIVDSGLFSQSEREIMIDNKMRIADRSLSDCLDEKYLFYYAVTCGFEKVFLSYCRTSMSGAEMEPSIEVNSIRKAFPNCNVNVLDDDFSLDNCEIKEASFRKLAEHYRDNSEDVAGLRSYFGNLEGYKERLDALEFYSKSQKAEISNSSALGIYGDVLRLSASKVDDFAGCKFMYFCKHGLEAKRLDKVDFDRRTRGNIVHDVLENFVKNHFDDIGALDSDNIKTETDELCDNYLKANCSDVSQLDEKFSYMMSIVKDTVWKLAVALNNEFKQSGFRPKFCELGVGSGKDVKGIDLKTDKGNSITLNGYIDRVDTTSDGKVRVIDYKTGSKGDSFKLAEILNGKNLQMLLYLHAILKNGSQLIDAKTPAGVLYFPAKRHVGTAQSDYVKMNGVVLDDVATLTQMESTLEGKLIPAHTRPNSTSFYSKEALLSEADFKAVFNYIEFLLQRIGNSIMNGDIQPKPLKTGERFTCEYCDYRSVCRFDPFRDFAESINCNNSEAIEQIRKTIEEAQNGN